MQLNLRTDETMNWKHEVHRNLKVQLPNLSWGFSISNAWHDWCVKYLDFRIIFRGISQISESRFFRIHLGKIVVHDSNYISDDRSSILTRRRPHQSPMIVLPIQRSCYVHWRRHKFLTSASNVYLISMIPGTVYLVCRFELKHGYVTVTWRPRRIRRCR